jgi:hypothetical protein
MLVYNLFYSENKSILFLQFFIIYQNY